MRHRHAQRLGRRPGWILIGNGFGSGNYTLTDPVMIDATTQPGYNGRPVIRLVGGGGDAFTITGGSSLIRGLAMQLGGEAQISPREGGGMRVAVTFPMPQDEEVGA